MLNTNMQINKHLSIYSWFPVSILVCVGVRVSVSAYMQKQSYKCIVQYAYIQLDVYLNIHILSYSYAYYILTSQISSYLTFSTSFQSMMAGCSLGGECIHVKSRCLDSQYFSVCNDPSIIGNGGQTPNPTFLFHRNLYLLSETIGCRSKPQSESKKHYLLHSYIYLQTYM